MDIAIQQMKPKGTYKVECPGSLTNKNTHYIQNSPATYSGAVTYEIEVLESSKQPLSLQPDRQLEEMVDGQCFYIVHQGKDKSQSFALEVSDKDAYAPRVTGVYNIALYPFKGRDHPNKAQQWVYNSEDHIVSSLHHKDGALFEGFNNNIIVYKNRNYNN